MSGPTLTTATADNSSTTRKVSIPVVAGALTILAVIAIHTLHVPISTDDLAVGAPAFATLLTAVGDIFIPDRFLA